MEYSTRYEQDSGIYVVTVSGDYHRCTDSALNKELVNREFQAHGHRLFLFDLRGARVHSRALATYEAGSNVPPGLRENLQRVRTAMVLDQLTEDDRFFENVVVNRGFALKVFADMAQARAWLLEG